MTPPPVTSPDTSRDDAAARRAVLLDALALKALPRAGWLRVGVESPESVAAHSWGIAWLVLALHPPTIDLQRALSLAVIHDLPEVFAGDITPHDAISPADKHQREADALQKLLSPLPDPSRVAALTALWREYADAATPEARFVKACDKLDMALQATSYQAHYPHLSLREFIDSALRTLSDPALRALLNDPSPPPHASAIGS
jgi:putative hydrolases of HD superfamily